MSHYTRVAKKVACVRIARKRFITILERTLVEANLRLSTDHLNTILLEMGYTIDGLPGSKPSDRPVHTFNSELGTQRIVFPRRIV